MLGISNCKQMVYLLFFIQLSHGMNENRMDGSPGKPRSEKRATEQRISDIN